MNDEPRDDTDQILAAVAALGDPLRRRLYRFVSAQEGAVSRDQVADGAGVSRSAAAFHLDRLVDEGLLETEFRRLTGRQGPGAGRPAKLYRRAAKDISVSLPARRYELAAGLLAAAVAEAVQSGTGVAATLDRVAREEGARIAAAAAPLVGRRGSPAARARRVAEALAGEGYEPRTDAGEVTLSNCPFSALVSDHPELTCHMNLALLEGFSQALPGAGVTAHLRPAVGRCCVSLEVGTS
jgi:predicted ArsR family transcriptional regulator